MARPTQRESVAAVSRRDDDDRSVVVADFGPGAAPSVDVVEGAALVVFEDGEQRQRELDLPDGEASVSVNNGVITVEVER
jgi:hypothetical protein